MGFFFEQAPAEQPSQPVVPKVETEIQPTADEVMPAEVEAAEVTPEVEPVVVVPEAAAVTESQETVTRNLEEALPALVGLEASATGRLSEIGRQIVEQNA